MTKPLVSAIITTKNRSGLLQRAVQSVSKQSYPNIELVVVDDGSTDDTSQILEKLDIQVPFSYIRNEQSQGACKARNQGIEAAGGEFIAGLDDDDEWHQERISYLIDAYNSEFACVTSDVNLVYPNKTVVWRKKSVITFHELLFSNQVGNQVLVKKERVKRIGGFDESLVAAQDYDLWVRLCAEYGPIRNVKKPLQNVYMDHRKGRITDRSFEGYLQFFNKHKHRFSEAQRKYQLYKIRRAKGKSESVKEFLTCVPASRYLKEIKRIVTDDIWT